MAGSLTPDVGSGEIPSLNISYKPQKISPKSQSTVRVLLHDKVRDAYTHPQVFLINSDSSRVSHKHIF